mgnify:CR=1 FL=1
MSEVTLRFATDADLANVAAIHIASWRATYADELSASYLASLQVSDRVVLWRQRLAQGAQLMVAEDAGGAPLGFCASGPSRDIDEPPGVWEIWNIHLSPDQKGRGLGSQLFDAGAELGRARGATQLTLWVVATNDRARRFYERKGMTCDGKEKYVSLADERMHEVRYRKRY